MLQITIVVEVNYEASPKHVVIAAGCACCDAWGSANCCPPIDAAKNVVEPKKRISPIITEYWAYPLVCSTPWLRWLR